ncbi:hypothetical protein L226DRAFT_526905 [Lentinus tigrinus ALCF2SS1-7]|uniref:BTB domain-containing protein n=1 Tax=Lentinus tigrinus ALCF2SS1-6 TaxID=1328759 RepID=A0A5C2S690_9APHY|nr:hypothetical protein L227DRAFT_176544 [Lentinus tigrinus ALCF2SS1-6]RPD68909.1 hypothetical protein L226DRAFT_526905 [Lentinus tigrinus ALCF2SS1-7]
MEMVQDASYPSPEAAMSSLLPSSLSPDISFQEDVSLPLCPTMQQIPTPPPSETGSPQSPDDASGNTIVSISTTFHPASTIHPTRPDTIFLSSDSVFFYVQAAVVLAKSTNNWNGLLQPAAAPSTHPGPESLDGPKIIPCPEPAAVLNIVLHVAYGLSCASYKPTIDDLSAAVDAMATYGLPPKEHIAPSTPLYALILSQAPIKPIAAYALAAAHNLHSLAVPISSHLLSYPLQSLPEDLAEKIGPLYLKRLFFLHLGRLDALRRLLLPPPHPHPPTDQCGFADQKSLTRAWALASAYLAWDSRPDLPASAIEAAFLPLADRLPCQLCKQSLVDRVKQVIVQWSMVKRSI